MKNLEVNVGTKRVVVDLDKLNIKRIKKLIVAIGDVKQRHLPQTKYPVLENETAEEWYKRVMDQVMEDLKKKDEESEETHAERLADLDLQDHVTTFGFEVLKEVVKVFDLKVEITDEDVEEAHWPPVRNFLFDLLSEAELGDASMFRPPVKSKQLQEPAGSVR